MLSPPRATRSLIVLMLLAVTVVAALAFWDEQRESAAALDDFAQEQSALAASVAGEVQTRLAGVRRDALVIAESLDEGRKVPASAIDGYSSYSVDAPSARVPDVPAAVVRVPAPPDRTIYLTVPPAKLLEGAARVERTGLTRVFLLAPPDPNGPPRRFVWGADGSTLPAEILRAPLDDERPSAWLDRAQAASLGLRPRRAAAGLAHIDAGPLGRWGIAVVTSALRVRDRESRAYARLALGVGVTVVIVLLFGTVALVRQRRGLLLEAELALAALDAKRDRELLVASRAATLGTLAMGIAHEVSTPLGVIAGRAEQLLPKVAGDERAARCVQAIIDQSERIRRVIRGFLDIVRGGAPELGDATPTAVLDGALALVDHRFIAAAVSIDRRVEEKLPSIHGDVPMLQQALVNLLLNACDACGRGGHVVASVEREGGSVAFTVSDDGRGITKEEAERATEPFFTTKAAGHGSGLGLAITSEIVKLHRGRLALSPATPRGTVAHFTVPIPEVTSHAA